MIVFSTVLPPPEYGMDIFSLIPWYDTYPTLNLIAPQYIFSSDESEENAIYYKWIYNNSNPYPYIDLMSILYKYHYEKKDICLLYVQDCGLEQSIECLQSIISERYGIVSRHINEYEDWRDILIDNNIGARKPYHVINMDMDIIAYLEFMKNFKERE